LFSISIFVKIYIFSVAVILAPIHAIIQSSKTKGVKVKKSSYSIQINK